ncbi:hypothetical protein RJT34_10698 [Clitoria ternatea]|uniref:NB-ARC domain-containing protein n=1 Tax=Clitoria ternatea TaxID=43366 RepID=A0AAN9PHS1_CLITE
MSLDCASGFLPSISTELVKTIVKELRYPCCFNNFLEDLKKEEGDLIATRDGVQRRVEDVKKQTRKPEEDVLKWLDNANIEANNVEKLLNEALTKKHCCVGHCPNWIWRYRLGKKLAKKKLVVEDHIKDAAARNFIQFDRIATLPSGLPDFLKDKCFNFESRQSAYDKLMEAIKDDEVSMIGLYGMGGCGKTTLAMQVGKVAETEHLFDEVLFVPVSSTIEIRRIQEKIASSLQYTFPENEERERAERLRHILTKEKKILVILDDVWQMLNFGDIGLPSRDDHKGDLKKLESLSLVNCSLLSFFESQNNVAATQPTKLRLLELLDCDMNENPFEVIKRIPNLEELYITHDPEFVYVDEDEDIEFFDKISAPQTLQSCFPISNETIKGLAKQAEVLHIENIKGAAKSIIPGIFEMEAGGSFPLPNFRRLELSHCSKLSGSLLKASIVKTMTSLEELDIAYCNELKYIVDGNDGTNWDGIFQRLQKITLWHCDKLEAIFPAFVMSYLPQLECLHIEACRELKQIFQKLQKIEIWGCLKLEAIFVRGCLPELECLHIKYCRELKQIFERGDTNVSHFTFQRLQRISIWGCHKLEAILPISCLPELEFLDIEECRELKQIFEKGDENVSQRPCFPKLQTLCIINCNKLISVPSFQCHLPNLTSLIICGASELQQVFEVPKLEVVILGQVTRFCQWNELQLQNVKHRFILNSPNLTSTVNTIEELKHKLKQEDNKALHIPSYILDMIDDEAKKASESGELPSPQELVNDQSMTMNESCPTNQPMAAAETGTTISIPQERDPKPKSIPQLQMNQQELPISERQPLSSEVIDNNHTQGSITGREHEQKRIEREELVSESYNDFLESDREGKWTPHLQPSKQKLSPISSPENIKEIGKEKIQEKATPMGGTIKTLAASAEGISEGGGVATHTESGGKDILAKDVHIFEKDIDDMIQEGSNSNLVDKERRTSVVCNEGVEIPPNTGARLGAYKQFVDLDDAQIALLAEAVEAYPHLWNVCNKYSKRFQALTLKTLADMLLFLRNESAVSISPEREKDFHGLCDEAVQLGFDRSWVDQMRQRVVAAKDPKLDDAQTRISELHMRHAHLTQELQKINNELKNLQEFVDAQTKCFNFL